MKLLTREQLEAIEICETEASTGCHDCPMLNEDCSMQNVAKHMLVLLSEYEELKKELKKELKFQIMKNYGTLPGEMAAESFRENMGIEAIKK